MPRLLAAIADLNIPGILVVGVDDGSPDRSAEVFEEWGRRVGLAHILVRHSRNYGQAAALLTALSAAEADRYVLMDADLEDDPAGIPPLLTALADHHGDLVLASRDVPKMLRPLSSTIYKTLVIWACGKRLPSTVGLFCAMTRPMRQVLISTYRRGDSLLVLLLMLAGKVDVVRCAPRIINTARPSSYTFPRKLGVALRAGRTFWRLRRARGSASAPSEAAALVSPYRRGTD